MTHRHTASVTVALLSFLSLMALTFSSCEQVSEATAYDNWKARNIAAEDSLRQLAGSTIVTTAAQADSIGVGRLFAIQARESTNKQIHYIYCRKLTENMTGVRPYQTDYVAVQYCGSDLTGNVFDSTFDGYTFVDRDLVGAEKMPTEFNVAYVGVPTDFISGWITALQYIREGERWMVYIPYISGYGTSDYSSIKGYSLLTFDMILTKVYLREE